MTTRGSLCASAKRKRERERKCACFGNDENAGAFSIESKTYDESDVALDLIERETDEVTSTYNNDELPDEITTTRASSCVVALYLYF